MATFDVFRGYLTTDIKNKVEVLNSEITIISDGMTSQLQVLHMVVNKDNFRKEK